MAKEVKAVVKVLITAGQANPAPPVGTALGPHGIDMPGFCSQFNERTRELMGTKVTAVITIYVDRSFTFIVKKPPASILILKKLGIEKGSAEPHKTKVGTLTRAQVEEIANEKMPDLNAKDLPGAAKSIAGTARSMGIKVDW